ncbi:hypothetical protein FGU71_00020 [Erythrobacter insulae]|uniref:Uncharacterized protein n=1 Tax=Erythrobacter insulae TaxID=2584124 RepID=A0A547P8E1_9SPHN|nr:CehA/McbA family metallohydrolase [Erythrobacter insulae]TRD10415.1 hypothetical protein FGU71_00020 [Erythrobacter insulae]
MRKLIRIAIALTAGCVAAAGSAQWTNHYPKVEGFSHQLYLEQEHLPILSSGPVYPAPSPDGTRIAFSHQGWIWVLNLATGVAQRVTDGAEIDSRPRWSPDSQQLAFVRDEGDDTAVVILRLSSGAETIIDSPAIELDPEFGSDGQSFYYTSARSGTLTIWKRDLDSGAQEELITDGRVRRASRSMSDGSLVYTGASGPSSVIRLREPDGETDRLLFSQGWMAHLDPDVHPSGRSVVYSAADGNTLRLAVIDADRPDLPRWLTAAGGRSLHPAFSFDGRAVYFVEADENQQFALMKIGAAGGTPEQVAIKQWDYGVDIGNLTVVTHDTSGGVIPARISLQTADGHPVVNPQGPTYVDNQSGTPYFYTDGGLDLNLPDGEYRITATRGPFSIPAEAVFEARGGESNEVRLKIDTIWDPSKSGYVSIDNHIHLNASGVLELDTKDLLPLMQGENLDYASPMAWNQFNRFIDAGRIGEKASADDGTTAMLSQEVRSNFHGHVGMIGLETAFNPWFFGPRDPVYTDQDFNNGQAIAFAQTRGALATYVHPINDHGDPFDDLEENPLPLELVLDGVLTPGIGLELVCQWTSPLGTSQVWYRFLNMGRAMPATSGTDMMANFYRAPAIGTARAYVPASSGADGYDAANDQVRQGRGFLSTGPGLLFEVGGVKPGDAVAAGMQDWTIKLASVRSVEKVEIIVNGQVIQTLDGFEGGGIKSYSGSAALPEGGWIAARAVGGETAWPSMAFFPFAHSAPVWIGEVGSTDPVAARAAAQDLLAALEFSETQFEEAYTNGVPPSLAVRFDAARQKLETLIK